MIKWWIGRKLAAFEREFDYDMSYARDVLAADLGAFMKFARAAELSGYRKGVPADVAFAVKLVGTLVEDCGPCTQLMVTMALKEGVDRRTIAAVLRGDLDALSPDVRLGVEFGRASLAHDPAADPLREEIVRRFGQRGLVSIAFCLVSARLYPTLKYALGHGRSCQRVVVAGEPIRMHARPEEAAA
ncbi:MAG: hypothetical protein U0414_04340 [Polyangiaceae bacterium]